MKKFIISVLALSLFILGGIHKTNADCSLSVSLIGSPTVSVDQGSVYTDEGATGVDRFCTPLVPELITPVVDTSILGDHTVTYQVSEPSEADPDVQDFVTVNRTVTVNAIPTNTITNPATNITSSDATLNGTNGSGDADQESFWVSLNNFDVSTPNIPTGVYSTPVLPSVLASSPFTDPLSIVSTQGITTGGAPGNLAITPNTTYYYAAWAHYNGDWHPGDVISFKTDALTQTINVGTAAPASSVYGSTFSVAASASSGLTVDISATGGCSVDSSVVTMTSGTDSCVIHYNQSGDNSYAPAPEVVETVTTSPKALSISGLTANNKIYDNTNVASLSGTATLGASEAFGAGSSDDGLPYDEDVISLNGGSAEFAGSNIGNGLAVTVSGITTSNTNYTITQPVGLTANITPLAITVTAVSDTKTYDGTTISLASPTVLPAIASGDFGFFWEIFSTKNVATGKTLTPHGLILDGNGGHNYTVTYVADTTGVITAKPITITADSGQGKIYGAANPTLTYHITNGHLVGFNTLSGSLGRAAGESVGAYAIDQGTLAAGTNYAITFVGSDFTITPADAPITITAGDLNQDYTGTPRSVGVTTVPEDVSYSLTYDGSQTAPTNAGTYSVVATITDPNYSGTDTKSLVIHKINPTIVVTTYNVAYDGASHTATGTATGVLGENLAGLDFTNTIHVNTGNYTEDSYTFTDTTGNYNNLEATVINDQIGLGSQTITFGALSDRSDADTDFDVSASASSGLPVTFTASGDCTISGNTIHLMNVGSCTIVAHQNGNENISAAPDVSQSFDIKNNSSDHHYGGIVGGGSGGGQVLGASTGPEASSTCESYIGSYIKFGANNKAEDVVKLQTFLNEHEGEKLTVSGVYDTVTFEAVKRFQLAHKDTVLKPWMDAGLAVEGFPTGYVYKTTLWTINTIHCGESAALPLPLLP
ncbi:MAG: MBG domain-containing protein [Patescibacteria group bacterium]